MAVLGLRFCARAFPSCGKRGPLFIAVRGPLTIAAPPDAEQRLQTRRLSNCGSRAQLLRGMWDLPRPGLEPVSPALAGRFSTPLRHQGSPWSDILSYLTGWVPFWGYNPCLVISERFSPGCLDFLPALCGRRDTGRVENRCQYQCNLPGPWPPNTCLRIGLAITKSCIMELVERVGVSCCWV